MAATYSGKPRGRPPGPPQTIEERFWSKVDKRGPDDCWLWTASSYGDGYGGFMIAGYKGKNRCIGAHRVAYALANGKAYDSVFVLHKCDTKLCCNPAHLFEGNHQDNMTDMAAKGRSLAKLKPEEAIAARALFAHCGWKVGAIAKRFNVNREVIYQLLARKTYKHVGADLTARELRGIIPRSP